MRKQHALLQDFRGASLVCGKKDDEKITMQTDVFHGRELRPGSLDDDDDDETEDGGLFLDVVDDAMRW